MIAGLTVAVVVPAFEEARFIAGVVESLPAFVDLAVVVDDASADGTAARAREARAHCHVDVWTAPENRGVGASIAEGFRRAMRAGADLVAVMAGDGQMDPADLRPLLEPLVAGRAEWTSGNRLAHPDVWRAMPVARHLGSIVLSSLTSAAAGVRVHDSQCGYSAFSRRALERIDLDGLWPRYGYPNDLFGALALSGARFEHVVVRPVYRDESSGLRPWHLGVMGFLIARVAWRRVGPRAIIDRPPQTLRGRS